MPFLGTSEMSFENDLVFKLPLLLSHFDKLLKKNDINVIIFLNEKIDIFMFFNSYKNFN
ncbi:hypothetical protein HYE05_00840 [Mycoplasmopsis bovis]|nr:hypothetical protein HYE05_00840 [Mycoplasmopsis bovis]